MIDCADDVVYLLAEYHSTARKRHKCRECHREIRPGESYLIEKYIDDGICTHKTCQHCQIVRGWLSAECGGWLYGGVREDILEHAYEGYGMDVKRMAVGIRQRWTRKNGALLPLPRMPKTSHEIAANQASHLCN